MKARNIFIVMLFIIMSTTVNAWVYNGTTCSDTASDYQLFNQTGLNSTSNVVIDFDDIETGDFTIFIVNYSRSVDGNDQPFDTRSDANTIVQEFTYDCSATGTANFCIRDGGSLVNTLVNSDILHKYNYSAHHNLNTNTSNISIWNTSDTHESTFLNQQFRNNVIPGEFNIEVSSGYFNYDQMYIWNGTECPSGAAPPAVSDTFEINVTDEYDSIQIENYTIFYLENNTEFSYNYTEENSINIGGHSNITNISLGNDSIFSTFATVTSGSGNHYIFENFTNPSNTTDILQYVNLTIKACAKSSGADSCNQATVEFFNTTSSSWETLNFDTAPSLTPINQSVRVPDAALGKIIQIRTLLDGGSSGVCGGGCVDPKYYESSLEHYVSNFTDFANFTTTNGSIKLNITGVHTFILQSTIAQNGGYFNKTIVGHNTSDVLDTTMFQAEIYFNATFNIGGQIFDFEVGAPLTNGFSNVGTGIAHLRLKAGDYTLDAHNREGDLNTTLNITVVALQNFSSTPYTIQFNLTVDDCSINNFTILRYHFINETDELNISGDLDIAFDIFIDNPDNITEFEFNSTNKTLHDFCLNSNGSDVFIDIISQGSSDGFATRTHFIDNLTLLNQTNTVFMYLLDIGLSTDVIYSITDDFGDPIPNAILNVLRYYIEQDTFKTVERVKVNSEGKALAHIVIDDVIYKYQITLDGNSIFDTTSDPVYASTVNINVPLSSSILSYYQLVKELGDTGFELSFSNSTKTFNLGFSVPQGTIKTVCLKVDRSDDYITQQEYNSTCVTTSGGTLSLQIPDDSASYLGYATVTGSPESVVASLSVNLDTTWKNFKTFGVVGTYLLTATAAGLGVFNPAAGIIFSTLGFISGTTIGMFNMTVTNIFILIILGGLLAFKVNRQ